jgi:hypothetical protein
MGRKSDYAFTNLSILGIWHTVRAQDRNERFSSFRIADDSGRVVNFIKHKVLILILPTHSADVIAIARSQPGGRCIRSTFPIIPLWRRISREDEIDPGR